MKKTTNFCDICKTCNGHISTDNRIQTISYSIDPTGNSDYSVYYRYRFM